MSHQLAKRLALVQPSATMVVTAKVAQLKAQGRTIINLGLGEPDFDTPQFIKEAAIQAIKEGFTKYTAVPGIIELRRAIANKFSVDNQLNYSTEQIIVSTGLKQSLFNLMLAVLNPLDEVIIPAPYWVSYPDMVLLAEGTPVPVLTSLEHGLKLRAADLAAAITPKTRMIILNSPANPTGVAYTRADLREIAEVLIQHPNILIASDDMYEHMYWGVEPFVNILNVAAELYDRTIVFNGFSKTYAMTGWRLGYAAGPPEIIQAMEVIQSQSTSSPNSIAQKAGLMAITSPQDCVVAMAKTFQHRYEFLFRELSTIAGMVIPQAQGAFYLYPYIQTLIDQLGLPDDHAFCDYLLEEMGVAVLPGSACGTPGFIRLSFAINETLLSEAVAKLKTIGLRTKQ